MEGSNDLSISVSASGERCSSCLIEDSIWERRSEYEWDWESLLVAGGGGEGDDISEILILFCFVFYLGGGGKTEGAGGF